MRIKVIKEENKWTSFSNKAGKKYEVIQESVNELGLEQSRNLHLRLHAKFLEVKSDTVELNETS